MRFNEIEQNKMACPECGGPAFSNLLLAEKQDACYNKVKSRYKVWPSAYASGALVQCRKKGAANWGNKSEGVAEGSLEEDKGIIHTRGSLVNKLKTLPKGSDDFEWNRIQAIHHLKQGNMLRAKYYMALMKRGEQGVAEGLPQTLRKVVPGYAKREIDKKMDAGKFGKTDADKDANFQRYKKIQDKIKEQGVAEGHADQQRKVFKKNGKPVGEVGIDRESSPGNGQWYMKCYAYDIDNSGYDSYEEAVKELKHCLEQGVAEGLKDTVKQKAKEFGKYMTEPDTPQQAVVRDRAKNIAKIRKNKEQGVAEGYDPEYDDEAGMAQGSLHTLQNAVAGLQDVIDAGDNLPEWCQEKISLAEDYLVTVWDYIQSEKAQGIDPEISEEFDMIERIIESIAAQNGVDAEAVWTDLESLTEDELYAFAVTSQLNEDWQKANKRDRTAGMSQKAVNAYRRENPGSKLKTAVTTKPSKLKKGSKASKRRKSYCSRSKGQMNMHNISCAKTPDKAICKARRRWNC